MAFLDAYRVNRAINALLAAHGTTTPDTVQAMKVLQDYGTSAIPKLIAACASTRTPEPLVKLLRTFVENETLPFFMQGLANINARVVAAVVDVLAQSKAYDPNLLLAFLSDPCIAKGVVGKLLNAHKRALAPLTLLRCLDEVSPQDRPMLLDLVCQTATAAMVPALMQRLNSPDENVRLACTRTLARFPSEAVREAFYKLLTDLYPMVRLTALDSLERSQLPLDLKPICQLLWDENDGVRREAKKFLTRCRDPQLINHLFDMLEDPSSEAQEDAADLLGTIRDAKSIQNVVVARPDATVTCATLLRILNAPHTHTRRAALVGLTSVKSAFDIAIICPLLWDSDRQIRRLTVAILTHYRVPQTLETLGRAFQDESSAVRQDAMAILNIIVDPHILEELLKAFRQADEQIASRAINLLGSRGEPPVIQTALQFMADKDQYLRHTVHTILTLTEDPAVMPYLVEALTNSEPWVRRCAAEVLGMLGDKGRDAVPTLLEMAQANEEEGVLALQVLTKIGDPRAIPVCLLHMQSGTPVLQEHALQALAVLTDVENFDGVLYPMLTWRDRVAADRKVLFNRAAAALIKRFPGCVTSEKLQRLTLDTSFTSAVRAQEHSATPSTGGGAIKQTQGERDAQGVNPMAIPSGAILGGRYQVIRRIGEGGFGTVVLAKDTMVKEELILKFLHSRLAADERVIQRFIQELLYARRITHENVIRIHDFLQIDNTYAIAMEYFPGHNLGVEVGEKRFLTDRQRGVHVLVSICRGMQKAHQIGIIHRDLKPTNILLNDEGVVKIVDFGLAAAVTEEATKLTRTGEMLGTPRYMSPEQARNSTLDARTDIYSLGVIMYEMLTGRAPYLGDHPLAILYQHVEGKPTLPRAINPRVTPEVEAIILKAMAADPARRFQSMEEFEQSLVPWLQ